MESRGTSASSSPRSPYAPPKLHVSSPYELSHGARVVATSELSGTKMCHWQKDVTNDWGAVDEAGKFVHRRCGLSVPRQAGKSTVAIAWAVYLAAVLGMVVLYTAHNYSTTCEMHRRVQAVFGRRAADPIAKHRQFNRLVSKCENKTGQEAVYLSNGGEIHFSTRTKTTDLGFSFDVVIYDEAQELRDEHMEAIAPTSSSGAAANAQSVFIGTPPRPGGAGRAFKDMRDEVMSGEPEPDLCWWEWGVDEVGDPFDESRWPAANPSLPGVADPEAIRMIMHVITTDLGRAQQMLGYWLPAGNIQPAIEPEAWEACGAAADERPADGKLAYGVKFSADGEEVALAVAVDPDEGPSWIELIAIGPTSSGTAQLASWLVKRCDECAVTVVDGRAGAGELVNRIAPSFPRKAIVTPNGTQASDAAATLLTCVREGSVNWFDAPDGTLDRSARTSPRRKIGSGGGWGFGGDDPTPVEACALALWGVLNTKRDQRTEQEIW